MEHVPLNADFINLTAENIVHEHLCCLIRSRKPHPGIEAKRQWLSERIREGHVLRKLSVRAPVFIEYAPLETAWVPIMGNNYYYVYCLWVSGSCKGKGYGRQLMEYCLADAREKGKSGICMLGAKCPYVHQNIGIIRQYCEENDVPVSFIQVDTLQKAKELPCVFNNWGVFYQGNFQTVNLLLDVACLKRILNK